MDHKTVEDYLLSFPNTKLDYPFGEGVAVYKVLVPNKPTAVQDEDSIAGVANVQDNAVRGEWKMFALIAEGKEPLRLSLKCDPLLAKTLREKYETVLEGYHLNKKHWNTILLTGQLPWDEIKPLIRHSHDLVTQADAATPEI